LLNRLKPKSEFTKNVLTLMTGTTIAQAIPIAISPILTRLYSPEDFGVFALFISLATIFGSVANARYELAIMLPKQEESAINIVALGLLINIALFLVLSILIWLFHGPLVRLLNSKEISAWLYFIPVVVFFMGLWNLLTYYNNRKKEYKDIAKATVIKAVITAVVQLVLGFLKQGAVGLISGQMLSQLFANRQLAQNIYRDKRLLAKLSKLKIIAVAKRYRDFPKFSMPSVFVYSLSQNVTNIIIAHLYSSATLGFFTLVQRVLGMPSSLIGGSIGQVFFQEATQEKQRSGKAIKSFRVTLKRLTLIGFPIFLLLFFTVEDIFAIVFGQKWRVAGSYAQILIPLFFIRFINTPVSSMNIVYERNRDGLYIYLLQLITLLLVAAIAFLFSLDAKGFFILFAILFSLLYLALLYYYYQLALGRYKEGHKS